jgi:hypothetical protein
MGCTKHALVVASLVLMAFVVRWRLFPPAASIQEVQRGLARTDPDLERIVVAAVPGRSHTFVAICDTQSEWWGDFRCIGYRRGRVLWTASIEGEEPGEQSIDSVRALRLGGFANPMIEVFGTTHMGHGNCYLYELRGRTLVCVLSTFALDCHEDLNLIRGGRLDVRYEDLNGDGYQDVIFTGVIDEFEDAPGTPKIRSTSCRKVFQWVAGRECFVEDRTARVGWDAYGDRR